MTSFFPCMGTTKEEKYVLNKKNQKAKVEIPFVLTKDGRIWYIGAGVTWEVWKDEHELEKEIGVGMGEAIMMSLLDMDAPGKG